MIGRSGGWLRSVVCWVFWVAATTLGAELGVALNAPMDEGLYRAAILSGSEDLSRAIAVAGSFTIYVATVALAQGAALTLIQRLTLRVASAPVGSRAVASADVTPGASGTVETAPQLPRVRPWLGWRWALATMVATLVYYPLLLFEGQPPFDRLGLPSSGWLATPTLYGALALVTLPIGALVGAAQGLALRGWSGMAAWRWLAVTTLAWGLVWPLGLLLGDALTFAASLILCWTALACVTGVALARAATSPVVAVEE